jgi:hypothetical protein
MAEMGCDPSASFPPHTCVVSSSHLRRFLQLVVLLTSWLRTATSPLSLRPRKCSLHRLMEEHRAPPIVARAILDTHTNGAPAGGAELEAAVREWVTPLVYSPDRPELSQHLPGWIAVRFPAFLQALSKVPRQGEPPHGRVWWETKCLQPVSTALLIAMERGCGLWRLLGLEKEPRAGQRAMDFRSSSRVHAALVSALEGLTGTLEFPPHGQLVLPRDTRQWRAAADVQRRWGTLGPQLARAIREAVATVEDSDEVVRVTSRATEPALAPLFKFLGAQEQSFSMLSDLVKPEEQVYFTCCWCGVRDLLLTLAGSRGQRICRSCFDEKVQSAAEPSISDRFMWDTARTTCTVCGKIGLLIRELDSHACEVPCPKCGARASDQESHLLRHCPQTFMTSCPYCPEGTCLTDFQLSTKAFHDLLARPHSLQSGE